MPDDKKAPEFDYMPIAAAAWAVMILTFVNWGYQEPDTGTPALLGLAMLFPQFFMWTRIIRRAELRISMVEDGTPLCNQAIFTYMCLPVTYYFLRKRIAELEPIPPNRRATFKGASAGLPDRHAQ